MVKLLWSTYRWTVVGESSAQERVATEEPMILTFWHEHLFVMTRYLVHLGREGVRVTYLISPSQDGEFAVRMLAVVGGRAVRGSATRSGVQAMHRLYRAVARDRASPVLIPDGPQGPRGRCKPGAVMLGSLSGAWILPLACAAGRGWRLRTWDRLLLPMPFTRVVVAVGEPYTLASGLESDAIERERTALESRLQELGERAQRIAAQKANGRAEDWKSASG